MGSQPNLNGHLQLAQSGDWPVRVGEKLVKAAYLVCIAGTGNHSEQGIIVLCLINTNLLLSASKCISALHWIPYIQLDACGLAIHEHSALTSTNGR